EKQLLATWKRERLFEQTQSSASYGPPFVFFEGPPTANGRPGIHHVFARTIKELVCRYQSMLGHGVTLIEGGTTHAHPADIAGAQGAAVLPSLRHGAVVSRARAELRDGADELGVRDLPVRRRREAPVRDLDHDAVDAALERRCRRASRPRVRRIRSWRDALRGRRGARGGRARRRPAARQRATGRRVPRARPGRPA